MNAVENYWSAVVRQRKQELDAARVVLAQHVEKVDLLRERLAQAETSHKHATKSKEKVA